MKKHTLLSDLAVFLLIIFLFIVPPFFAAAVSPAKPLFSGWNFPWYQLLLALMGFILLFFYYEFTQKRTLIVFPILFTFGMLFAVSLFCRFLSEMSGLIDGEFILSKPSGALQWFFCLVNFFFAAFYEEVLYRFYFVDELFCLITSLPANLAARKKILPFIWILCEILALVCFAFAHLYMGWISVLNAALAHVFLRLCYKKTGKLWPCVASHFIYNVISLILL